MKRFEKRLIAIFLSLVLAAGMLWGAEPIEAEAADSMSVTIRFTLEGLEGAEMPNVAGIVVDAHKTGYPLGTESVRTEIGMDEVDFNIDGNCVTCTFTIEAGSYRLLDVCLMQNGKPTLVVSMGDEQHSDYVIPDGAQGEGRLCRFRFMDGSRIWYEHYAMSSAAYGPFLSLPGNPLQGDHVFQGWTKEKDSSTLWNFNDTTNALTEPATFYAVWQHPAEDTWAWNHDENNHWKECSCGELKAATEAHTWNDGIITRQPTDTLEGETTYTCADCGATKTEPIPATGKPAVSGNDPILPGNPEIPGTGDISTNTPGTDTNVGNAGNAVVNGTSVNTSVNTTTTAGKNKEPKTGSIPYIEIYATVAMIAGMTYLFLYFCDDRHGISEEEKQELMSQLIAWAKKGGHFRKIMALTAIFFLLCYYHSIGKKISIAVQSDCL